MKLEREWESMTVSEQHDALERMTLEFLANGGKIKVLPLDLSNRPKYRISLTKKQYRRDSSAFEKSVFDWK
jgi:hypothetical protein